MADRQNYRNQGANRNEVRNRSQSPMQRREPIRNREPILDRGRRQDRLREREGDRRNASDHRLREHSRNADRRGEDYDSERGQGREEDRGRSPMRRREAVHDGESTYTRNWYRDRSRERGGAELRDRSQLRYRRHEVRGRTRGQGRNSDRDRSPDMDRTRPGFHEQEWAIARVMFRSAEAHKTTCQAFKKLMDAIWDDMFEDLRVHFRLNELRRSYEEGVRAAGARFPEGYDSAKEEEKEKVKGKENSWDLMKRSVDAIENINAYLRYQNDRVGSRRGLDEEEEERAEGICLEVRKLLVERQSLQGAYVDERWPGFNHETQLEYAQWVAEHPQGRSRARILQDRYPIDRSRHDRGNVSAQDGAVQYEPIEYPRHYTNQPSREHMICNNCHETGHLLEECIKVDELGYTRGCPLHNSMDHDFWKCERRMRLTGPALRYYLFVLRNNKPQWAWGVDIATIPLLRKTDPQYRPWGRHYANSQKYWHGRDYSEPVENRDPIWDYINFVEDQADGEYAQEIEEDRIESSIDPDE